MELRSGGCKLALGKMELKARELEAKDMSEVKAGFYRVS